jgi:hypothetical protein
VADETCRTYKVDGEPVVVRGDGPLDEQSRDALGELVRAAKEHVAQVAPHAAVIQELIAAARLAVHCIPDGPIHAGVLGERDGAEAKERIKLAVAVTRATLLCTQEEADEQRGSRQAWAEEAMRLDVEADRLRPDLRARDENLRAEAAGWKDIVDAATAERARLREQLTFERRCHEVELRQWKALYEAAVSAAGTPESADMAETGQAYHLPADLKNRFRDIVHAIVTGQLDERIRLGFSMFERVVTKFPVVVEEPDTNPDDGAEDPPELPEYCVGCRASCEDSCSCADGYQPVRVI